MMYELSAKILEAKTIPDYEQAVTDLSEYLYDSGLFEQARKVKEISILRKNIFSKREANEDLAVGKNDVIEYCRTIQLDAKSNMHDTIKTILTNFPLFCRRLYKTRIHEKCGQGVKEHLTGFSIDNEYDLQKLMLAVLSAYYPDSRTESVL